MPCVRDQINIPIKTLYFHTDSLSDRFNYILVLKYYLTASTSVSINTALEFYDLNYTVV
jgi:hypothetical protein